MKLKLGDSVFVWYFESICRGRASGLSQSPFQKLDNTFFDENSTIVSEIVFKSEIFQTLLKDKINGLY